MPSTFIKEKLIQAANNSPSFVGLPLDKQAEMISALENSSDQQVVEAIKAFEDDKANAEKEALAKQEQQKKLVESAASLAQEVKAAQVEMIKVEKDEEESAHLAEVDSVESQITKLNEPAPKPKRKKFLGIF